jgi:Dyp-type peroxidase family
MEQTIREAPASPLITVRDDAAHTSDRPNDEPLICADNIQGNSLAGFLKDYQHLLFLRITDAASFKGWLTREIPYVATVAEVLAFNRLFKTLRARRKTEGGIKATWLNIAFTAEGLRQLLDAADVDDGVRGFADAAFKAGLFLRSSVLNDPPQPQAEGYPGNWLFGGSAEKEPHAVMICQSDDPNDLERQVDHLRTSLEGETVGGKIRVGGATIIYEQPGATLPDPLKGHEHFGFLDGVSQPGIRGKLSDDVHDLITLRQNPNDASQGKPGQDCLYPGEFVFGYLRQDPNASDIGASTGSFSKARAQDAADWTDDGSFLVIRRLRQNVAAFKQYLQQNAAAQDLTEDELGAALVGRHKHGAPVIATSNDDLSLGADDCRNNFFEFQQAPVSGRAPNDATTQCDPGTPPSEDPTGRRCPFTAHIRKVYPRDDTSTSIQQLKEPDTQTHRLLRRGIPFGGPFDPDSTNDDGNRGLLFAAYQSSIVNQFEFVTTRWANNVDFKENGVGPDPIIGQMGANRSRTVQTAFTNDDQRFHEPTLSLPQDFVIPTGGAYFFAPSIDALWFLAGVNDEPSQCKGHHVPPQPPKPPAPPY